MYFSKKYLTEFFLVLVLGLFFRWSVGSRIIFAHNYYTLLWENVFSPTHSELIKMLSMKGAQTQAQNFIEKARQSDYEVGGVMFMVEIGGVNRIKYEEIENRRLALCREIRAHWNDQEYLKNIYFSHADEFKRNFHSKAMYEKVAALIKQNARNGFFVHEAMSSYLDISYSAFELDVADIIKRLGGGKRFIGTFHVHTGGSPPSESDLEASQHIRSFVLADKRKSKEIIFYEIYKGAVLLLTILPAGNRGFFLLIVVFYVLFLNSCKSPQLFPIFTSAMTGTFSLITFSMIFLAWSASLAAIFPLASKSSSSCTCSIILAWLFL